MVRPTGRTIPHRLSSGTRLRIGRATAPPNIVIYRDVQLRLLDPLGLGSTHRR